MIQPVFSFLIDREGHSSWVGKGKAPRAGWLNPDTSASPKEPLTLLVENGSANFLDERNGQAFSLEDASANITIGDETELDVFGTALLNGQLARIEAQVKSMRRVGEDGSPFDLTVTAPALTVNFTGRLATPKSSTSRVQLTPHRPISGCWQNGWARTSKEMPASRISRSPARWIQRARFST